MHFFHWLVNYSIFGMGVAKFTKKFVLNKHEGCRSVGRPDKSCLYGVGEVEAECIWRTVVLYATSCIQLKAGYIRSCT